MNIAVVGTGYVGLVTGTCFAETGNVVTCIDIDEVKINKMKKGKIPIYEPELENMFKRNIKENRLRFTNKLEEGIHNAEVIFLALPTPPGEDGSADLSYILKVAEKLSPLINRYTIIIDKSTVPIGTAELVKSKVEKNAKFEVDIVSNPEFLREGFAVSDFMKPDRIVIGTSSKQAITTLNKLYSPFVRQGNPIYYMDIKSAEMTKYAANSFLATKISFMNEIANLCELVGANVDSVRLGIGSDERIGKRFLFPGIGYGGSCFPKDVKALQHIALENEYDFQILKAVHSVNESQKEVLSNKIINYYNGNIKGKTFAVWGIAFKPDTDDIREAPAIEIIKNLTSKGANIIAYDPEAIVHLQKLLTNNSLVKYANDSLGSLKDADALIIATGWSEFRSPDFNIIKKALKMPVIFDGRNLYDPIEVKKAGFHYESIGRPI